METGLFELTDLQIPRVDAVRHPAVRRKFLVLKEVDGMEKVSLTPEDIEDVKEALKLLYPLWEEGKIPDEVITQLSMAIGYPTPGEAYPKPYEAPTKGNSLEVGNKGGGSNMKDTEKKETVVQAQNTAPNAPTENVAKAQSTNVAPHDAPSADTPKTHAAENAEITPVEKGDRDFLMKELAAAKKQLAELEAVLKAERRARQLLEKTAIVEKEFAGLPIEAGELADFLLDLEEKFKDDPRLPKVVEALKRAAGMIRASEALKSAGVSVPTSASSAALELEQKAQKLLQEGKAKTLEEARAKVLKSDRDLFERYRSEVSG